MSIYIPNKGDVPIRIEERLKEIDPDLFVKVVKSHQSDSSASDSGGLSMNSQLVDRLAICVKWPERDPRRERVRNGSYPAENAFDLLALLPHDITFEQVPGYLERVLRRMDAPRRVVEEVAKWNEDQSIRNGKSTFEYNQEVLDRVEYFRKKGSPVVEIPDPLSD